MLVFLFYKKGVIYLAGTDFSHLTNDELIKGIKALKLPDYIRSKAYGIDVRETLAQMTEMTIQLGVNMGLSPDDALEMVKKIQYIDAQLAQKVGLGKKAELEDLSADVLSAIEGGEGTEFNLLSIPQDKSVKTEKTTFMKTNKVATFDMIRKGIDKNGNYADSTLHVSSEKLDVNIGNYFLDSSINYDYIVYGFDGNGDFIPGQAWELPYFGAVFSVTNENVKQIAITTAFGSSNPEYIDDSVQVNLRTAEREYLLPEYLPEIPTEKIKEKTITARQTTFVDDDLVGSFDVIDAVPDNFHISSSNRIPIETNVLYRMETNCEYLIRITGHDELGNVISGQMFSYLRDGDTFNFTNENVASISFSTNGGGSTPTQQIPTDVFVDILDTRIKKGIKKEYLPDMKSGVSNFSYNKKTVFGKNVDFESEYFRIPFGLSTKHDTLIVGSDIRMSGASDFGDNRIGVARLEKDGEDFTDKQEVIRNNFVGTSPRAMDGLVLYDEIRDEIYVFGCKLTDYKVWYSEGATRDNWDVVYVKSIDDGITWSDEVSIKHVIEPFSDRDRFLTGVGTGVQMKSGTLILPIQYSKNGSIKSGIVHSNNHGETWEMGSGEIPEATSENNVIETQDGTLMMNARSFDSANIRHVYTTDDLGETWTSLTNNVVEDGVIETVPSMASMIKHVGMSGKEHILLSSPYSVSDRSRFTLFKTLDNGENWHPLVTYHEPPFDWSVWEGYTCLVSLNGKLFVIVENYGDLELWDLTMYTPIIEYEPNIQPKR